MSLLNILEPEDRLKYMGYNEVLHKVGIGLGPVLGSILYELVGFIYMFMIFGLYHLIYIPLAACAMPKDIDSEVEENKILIQNMENSSQPDSEITL